MSHYVYIFGKRNQCWGRCLKYNGEYSPDGQSTVGPVSPPLKKGLVLFVKVEGAEQRLFVFIPGGLRWVFKQLFQSA